MRVNSKNGRLVCTMVLFLVLCVALFVKGRTNPENEGEILSTATPTPEVPLVLSNVWLLRAEGTVVEILWGKEKMSYQLASPLPVPISECVADLTVDRGIVTGLVVQQDTIGAKVLRIGENFVELEGYGVLELEEDSRVYRMYSGVEEGSWTDVLVGYTTSEFVLSGDRICAALVKNRRK